MAECTLVFPHQLFAHSPAMSPQRPVLVVEEHLFFHHFNFHKLKLAYHRATILHYTSDLRRRGFDVQVLEQDNQSADARRLGRYLAKQGTDTVHYCDPVDDWLARRLNHSLQQSKIKAVVHDSPMFLNSTSQIETWYQSRSRLYQTDFYIDQRKRLGILLNSDGKPQGGKWSYDTENRLRYPKTQKPPAIAWPRKSEHTQTAAEYVNQQFADNYGATASTFQYPASRSQALKWLDQFLEWRLSDFGVYEDAIVLNEPLLNHSLLTPMLNLGLITPREVIDRTLEFAEAAKIPLNSLEGFLRQIIGWREFIRAVYHLKGRQERTTNYWQFKRRIPSQFWQAQTGIEPLDAVIQKVLKNAYCHHIERLMVLGNFMLLCEFDPDDVYRWFMELFIDAYDWVMVPNVYGMSQFADGGLMATKPYISGSNYLMKMSDASKGPWQEVWDALFWRFMHVHREFFMQNPRLGMLVGTFDRMKKEKQQQLLHKAEEFLSSL